MLQPKRTKWRRTHLIKPNRVATRCNTVAFGTYGLAATEPGYISNKQIEAARVVLSKYTKKVGKSYIRVFPYLGITKKPAEVRMGNGKGQVESWNAVIEKGTIMFEVGGLSEQDSITALRQAGYKLAVTSRVVKKGEEKK